MIPSKYTRLMIQDTVSIASILNSRLGLDREDFKLNYDTIKLYMFNNPEHSSYCLNHKDSTWITIKIYTFNDPEQSAHSLNLKDSTWISQIRP